MNVSLKQRLVVSLLCLFIAAIAASLVFKSLALICYSIAIVLILAALGLALNQVSQQQRKLAYLLVPIVFLLAGFAMYVFLHSLHK